MASLAAPFFSDCFSNIIPQYQQTIFHWHCDADAQEKLIEGTFMPVSDDDWHTFNRLVQVVGGAHCITSSNSQVGVGDEQQSRISALFQEAMIKQLARWKVPGLVDHLCVGLLLLFEQDIPSYNCFVPDPAKPDQWWC